MNKMKTTPILIDQSISLWLKGSEFRWIDMAWFWFWLWLGIERDSESDPFDWAEPVAYTDQEFNAAVSMTSGPFDAVDWTEFVARFPAIGYAARSVSNY